MANGNGGAALAKVSGAALLLLLGWLSASMVEVQSNRFTAEDGAELVREDNELWKALYQEQAFKSEILRQLQRIEERLP